VSEQQHDQPPELHALNPRTMTLAQIIDLFRKLTGREPTAEEVKEANLTGLGHILLGKGPLLIRLLALQPLVFLRRLGRLPGLLGADQSPGGANDARHQRQKIQAPVSTAARFR
jgi:hypothetical protein